jgi:hypothetical protein
MAWTWHGSGRDAQQSEQAAAATALLCDAAVASYLREVLDESTRGCSARLGLGVAQLPTGARSTSGPHHYAVLALLDRLRSLRPNDLARLVRLRRGRPAQRGRDGPRRCTRRPGRLPVGSGPHRAAGADAAGQAIDTAAIPLADRAGGVWNMLSGAVQALVVRDLLDTATAHRLLAPVVAALGPAWLGMKGVAR